ncbi:MAG TPA: DUF3300 domain-containing protein [Vicinamibacterales bacterium]|jgi:Protein of unknown function (DUF3300)|nr:DUF3300 domain-containing protein [Vicinamibacterales bacterium]
MHWIARLTGGRLRVLPALVCAAAVAPGDTFAVVISRPQDATTSASSEDVSRIPPEQLDSLVAPIALYPDPLLAQVLAASTYPLELMQLQQWLQKNSGLKDKALVDAVSKQPWDPSIQAMAALPDVVKRLADDIQWTTDLGNAFLAQENDLMDAVQRMRQKAEGTGNLKSTQQQVVETKIVENKEVIVIEQANPQVVYVPSYNPTVVYGPPVYPYPPIYYPPPGYYAAGMAVSFGVGVAMGAMWSGGWGWGASWGHNDIEINRNNNFNRNVNVNGNRNTWQHNSQHRGGAPYRDRATANRYGGTARGESLANRQAGARQQVSREGGNLRSGGAVGTSGQLANRAGSGQVANRAGNAGSGQLANRAGSAGSGQFGSRAGSAGADRVGSRDLSRSGSGSSAFGGSDRFNGSTARANSSRGSSSMRSSGASRPSGGFSGGGGRSHGGGGGRSRGGGGGGRR